MGSFTCTLALENPTAKHEPYFGSNQKSKIFRLVKEYGHAREPRGFADVWYSDRCLDFRRLDLMFLDLLIEGTAGDSQSLGRLFNATSFFV